MYIGRGSDGGHCAGHEKNTEVRAAKGLASEVLVEQRSASSLLHNSLYRVWDCAGGEKREE